MAIESIMRALAAGGFLEAVWESKEKSEILSMSWDPNLTFRLKDQLNISYDKMDQLRYAFSHHRVGARLVPRPWVINPFTGETIRRDRGRGYLPTLPEAAETATTVLGADGFSAGNMSMMHVGVSIAPSYVAGVAQANEINLSTVATSRTDDHWAGLDTTLAGGYYSATT